MWPHTKQSVSARTNQCDTHSCKAQTAVQPSSIQPHTEASTQHAGKCGHVSAGVVCDRGLTLKDLIGTLKMFFDRLGLKKLRFKPAYNPYTEPSMEIFRYRDVLTFSKK